ncbi:MAG: DUF1566 domain-containing protein [Methylococcales bacterium]
MIITRTTTQLLICALVLMPLISNAQTCVPYISASTPDSQFTNNNDGTVTDIKTGLMWKRCTEGQTFSGGTCTGVPSNQNWQAALQQVKTVNVSGFAGFNDWRLPNINELNSIVEWQCYLPALNLNVFPDTLARSLWSSSSSSNIDYGNFAWRAELANTSYSYGASDIHISLTPKDWTSEMRLVRTVQ